MSDRHSAIELRSAIAGTTMIIALVSFKGGVGKSTSSIHIAAYLSTKGKTVLADGDLNRSSYHWAKRGGDAVPFQVFDQDNIDQTGEFDHLVIDTPARPGEKELLALAESSDLLVIPTHPSTFALEALIETIGTLQSLPPDRYKILLTAVPPFPSREGAKAKSALEGAGLPIFKKWIRRFAVYQKSENLGVPVYDVRDSKAAEAWKDYQAVGREILK